MGRFRKLTRRMLPGLLLAMLFGAFAPRGFMPHFGPEGLTIELCSGLGNKAATIASDDPRYQDYLKLAAARSGEQDHDQGDDADNPMPPCAFAGMAMLAVPVDAVIVPQMAAADQVPPALHHQLLRARHHAATPPATGPPLFS
jgi:hypothetical protein